MPQPKRPSSEEMTNNQLELIRQSLQDILTVVRELQQDVKEIRRRVSSSSSQ